MIGLDRKMAGEVAVVAASGGRGVKNGGVDGVRAGAA